MARISFSPLVEEIIGKLAGSVFQDSYGGMQVRTRVTPRNPQSNYQQLRRGNFGFLSASWRGLTAPQRQSFIDGASTPPAALNLFLKSNINLTLVNEPTISTYVPGSSPGTMPISFVEAHPGALLVVASGSPTTVPSGLKLLLSTTSQKPPTRIFTSPSDFSPIISFDEGTDLSVPQNIINAWQSRYGVLNSDKRLCLQSALIDKSNGNRGDSVEDCIQTEVMPFYKNYFIASLDQAGTSAPTINFAASNVTTSPMISRSIAGVYSMTFPSDFLSAKTLVFITGGNTTGPTCSGVVSVDSSLSFFATAASVGVDDWQDMSILLLELP